MYRNKSLAGDRGSILKTLRATEMLDSRSSLPAGAFLEA